MKPLCGIRVPFRQAVLVLAMLWGAVPVPANSASSPATAAVAEVMMEGMLNLQEGRPDDAIPKLEWVIQQDPRRLGAWESLGWAYVQLGRHDDARRLWQRLAAIDPLEPRAYNLLGKLAVAENRLEEAKAYFRKSLELQPGQTEIQFAMGRILRWEGRLDGAAQLLESLLSQDPDRTDIVLELATALMNNWEFSAALPYWKQLLSVAPEDSEYRAKVALCLLHANRRDEAMTAAREVLAREPRQVTALEVMANAYEMGGDPEAAVPYLERWLETLDNPERERVRVRLIRLYVRLHRAYPHRYPLTRAIALSRERLDWDPDLVDAHLLLGELILMEQRYIESEQIFLRVLEEYNAHNLRARKGLFEGYLADRRYRKARGELEHIAAFNPRNPYLAYYEARYHAARGDFYRAGQALNRLEAAGRRGAVGVLLYHGLVESDYFPEALSVRRFRAQLEALTAAEVGIVRAGDLPEQLDTQAAEEPIHSRSRRARRRYRPPMRAVVDFDDGRVDSMRHGTPIGHDLGLGFSMNIPVGYVARQHPFIVSWDDLKHYRDSGVWEFGSHFLDGAILAAIHPEGRHGPPLPNLLWLPERGRMETLEEYLARLEVEFSESRAEIEARLGVPVTTISYPFGDIGQDTGTNLENPTSLILAAGRPHYRVGFIQSEFGYALAGDDPMLYQRREMERWQGGEDTVDHLFRSHPVYLARRMRAEFAALAAKRHEARRTLRQLADTNYPERPLEEVKTYVRRRTARRMAAPRAGDAAQEQSFFKPQLSDPYIGIEGEHFRDSLGHLNWRVLGKGGLHLTPYISIEGKGGRGQLLYGPEHRLEGLLHPVGMRTGLRSHDREPGLVVDETAYGGALNLLFPNGMYLTGEVLYRDFDPPAREDVLAYALTGYVQPWYLLDVQLRYEHDLVPSARAAVEGLRYDALMGHAVLGLQDWWDLTGSVMFFNFSDDNRRDHLLLSSRWRVWERTGLFIGCSYGYSDAARRSAIYWSPNQLTRYFLEAGFQGNYLRVYYLLRVRYGLGRERLWPEAIEERRELEDRARRLRFDPGPPLEEPGWVPVFGLSASTRMPLGKHWLLEGEYSYNELPNYREQTVTAGVILKF